MESSPSGSPPTPMPASRRLLVRLLHGWGRLTRGMTLGVRAVVINEDGAVLLLRHTYVPGWHLPGGAVDPGETIEAAVIRELFEETAVIPAAPPRLHGLMLNLHLGARDHVAVYVVDCFTQAPPRVPNREIAEIGFFPPGALPEATSPATRRRIVEVLTGAPAAALW
ncbi:NUDIX hydrolase [Ancylobacter novellus DSM 506]|uniref:NUDIX hydrolase n=1 Tax=Ancylobacter novellus (strain ATCC 8093 / DSM 506 / JCM 20403 / CCM 1077 / IAM 12100 / NBRC 12443 / NCIMB 10456) TaxID=639283 RepID=D7A4E7_ANCN5|nr:NUDIX domain-containing protein [Ancylobacter novellus]ADH89810.1 NUDIX hydrolase [Ancylobacter novellus DSM 506]